MEAFKRKDSGGVGGGRVVMTELNDLLQKLNTMWNNQHVLKKHIIVWLLVLGEIWGWSLLWSL